MHLHLTFMDFLFPTSISELLEDIKKEADKWFDQIKQKTNDINKKIQLKTEVIATDRSTAGAIVEYAEHKNINLIVIGTWENQVLKECYLEVLLLEL